jgi:hypothetical protein
MSWSVDTYVDHSLSLTIQEFARGASLTSSDADLVTLLEICDPVEPKTKAQRRAAGRDGKKGDEQQTTIPAAGPTTARQRRAAERLARIQKEKGLLATIEDGAPLVSETTQTETDGTEPEGSRQESGEQDGQHTTGKSHDATLAAALAGLAVAAIDIKEEDDEKATQVEDGESAGRE